MNTWRDRLLVGLILLLVQQAHADINEPLPNTQFWALIFYGTAGALEALIALSIPKVLNGSLCDDMQNLAIICISMDAIGFMAYSNGIQTLYYNTAMWVLSCSQWVRLIFVDSDHARTVGTNLVRRSHPASA